MTRGSTKILGYGALAMATAVIASGCERTAAIGRAPGVSLLGSVQGESPTKDQIWAGCELGDDTVEVLRGDMERGGLETPVPVAFAVLYTFGDNGGQPLPDQEGHTGPVICSNTAVMQDPPTTVQQTDDIEGPLARLDVESAAFLLYLLNGGVESRYCHAVESGRESKCLKFKAKP